MRKYILYVMILLAGIIGGAAVLIGLSQQPGTVPAETPGTSTCDPNSTGGFGGEGCNAGGCSGGTRHEVVCECDLPNTDGGCDGVYTLRGYCVEDPVCPAVPISAPVSTPVSTPVEPSDPISSYGCTINYQCVETLNGPFADMESCTEVCVAPELPPLPPDPLPPVTTVTYTCIEDGQCIEVSEIGEYTDLASCETECVAADPPAPPAPPSTGAYR